MLKDVDELLLSRVDSDDWYDDRALELRLQQGDLSLFKSCEKLLVESWTEYATTFVTWWNDAEAWVRSKVSKIHVGRSQWRWRQRRNAHKAHDGAWGQWVRTRSVVRSCFRHFAWLDLLAEVRGRFRHFALIERLIKLVILTHTLAFCRCVGVIEIAYEIY